MEFAIIAAKVPVSLGRCFSVAAEVYRRNVVLLVLAAVVFDILALLSLFVLAGPLAGGIALMTLRAVRHPEHRVEFGDLFATFGQFWPMLGLFFVTLILTLLGLAALILPGLLLNAIWMFPFYVMADRRTGVFAALRISSALVRQQGFWRNFWIATIALLLSIGPSLVVPYVGSVVAWFVSPLAWLLIAVAYHHEAGAPGAPTPALLTALETPEAAVCGRCGYAMRGITTFNCPECGADLREVGMLPPR